MPYPLITITRHKHLHEKLKKLHLDLAELLSVYQKKDPWQTVRGLLPKHPAGLRHQRNMRQEWL